MIAVAYLRRSKKSDESTVSLQTQEVAVRNYCEAQGFTLAAVLSHDGVSGTKRKRFGAIDIEVAKHNATCVVIYNLDRLARDASGLLDYLKQAQRRGIQIHEVTSGRIDIEKSLGRFVTSIRGAMDEFYAGVIGEKTRDALAELRRTSRRYSNIPPFGFRYEGGALVGDAEEQRALLIIAECRAGKLGRIRTLKRLRAAGYSGRGSGATIQKLLEKVCS